MSKLSRHERDAISRMRAAMLDLSAAHRYTESNELLDIIERIEPPAKVGEAGSAGSPVARAGRSEAAAIVPPVAAPPGLSCSNCGSSLAQHCTTHLIPCCPGSLMHGQDEGTWTPSDLGPR